MISSVDKWLTTVLKILGVTTVAVSIITNHITLWAILFLIPCTLGILLIGHAKKENVWYSQVVKISPTHTVINTGLYAIVRHPQYLGTMFVQAGIVMTTFSAPGSMFSICCIALILIRIHYEEDFLSMRLMGYADYRKQVRYRLIPFVW